MFIQKIRQSKNKLRVPLIIMVAVLGFGLVGSFAVWSSPNLAANDNSQIDLEQIIDSYQSNIEAYNKDLEKNSKSFAALTGIANARYNQAQAYAQNGDNKKSKEVFSQALENYLMALDNVPAELNSQGKADFMVKAADCAWSSDQGAVAGSMYQAAVDLAPDHFDGRRKYAMFLVFKENYSDAIDQLTLLKENLKDGDENIAVVDDLIKGIQNIADTASASESKEAPVEEKNN